MRNALDNPMFVDNVSQDASSPFCSVPSVSLDTGQSWGSDLFIDIFNARDGKKGKEEDVVQNIQKLICSGIGS